MNRGLPKRGLWSRFQELKYRAKNSSVRGWNLEDLHDLEDDLESATGTMMAQAEFHRNNPNWIVEKISNHKETI